MDYRYIKELYENVSYWHGTGRYKYTSDGKDILDILLEIVREGGLIPHDDSWDERLGNIQSISLAKSRIYGRLYATMFSYKGILEKEYGSRWIWYHYFFGTARILAFIGSTPWTIIKNYPQKLALWSRKITKRRNKNLFQIFKYGSDIKDNYPILIGIKQVPRIIKGSRVFNLHEIRTDLPIQFEHISHIEVPRSYLKETENIFKNLGIQIRVLALEETELYCKKLPLKELLFGKYYLLYK